MMVELAWHLGMRKVAYIRFLDPQGYVWNWVTDLLMLMEFLT